MQRTLELLKQEHELISSKIDFLDSIDDSDLFNKSSQIEEVMDFFSDFVFKTHHKRESDFLYKWMVKQNKKSDKAIIDTINDEHDELEALVVTIGDSLKALKENTTREKSTELAVYLSEFTREYKKHIQKEEGFIFLIAESMVS